jgi:nucleoside-diphosphate-sugar epimerase
VRLVITGASGFVGRDAIMPLLARDAEVHLLCRSPQTIAGTTAYRLNLLSDDPAPLLAEIRPTHLMHLAWYAEPGKFWNAPENLDWVAASLRLVRAFTAAGGHRALVAGTCAEYDWSQPVLSERNTPLNPATLYGEAKASLFRVLEKAAPTLRLSFAWGRIFHPYGPFESSARLMGSVLDAVLSGRCVALSEGLQERDFMHVSDVAAALVDLLASDVEGAVNIGSGEAVAVRALVEKVAAMRHSTHLMRFGARPMQTGEPPRLVADTNRLEQEVGFQPRFNLDTGLADALARRRSPPFK